VLMLAYIAGAICWLGLFGFIAYGFITDKHR
jgi:hypothetical protein